MPGSGRTRNVYRRRRVRIHAEGNDLSRSPREILESLSEDGLALAAEEAGLSPGSADNRAALLESMASRPDVDAVLSRAIRRRLEVLLGGMRVGPLRELGKAHGLDVGPRSRKADIVAALAHSPDAAGILAALEGAPHPPSVPDTETKRLSREAYEREVAKARDSLAAARDAILEAGNEGAAVGSAESAWTRAAGRLDTGDIPGALEDLERASRLAAEARAHRIQELRDSLSSVGDHIALARTVGAEVADAEAILRQATSAFESEDYASAGDLLRRAERLAIQGQQRQIEKALELRESQIRRAHALIAASEPMLQEAESYGLAVTDARILLRQARDVLAKGDYVGGLTMARNAEDAVRRLEVSVLEERRRRGILKPTSGICGVCRSRTLYFHDDGWGRCADCGNAFRWRGPAGVVERLRGLLGT